MGKLTIYVDENVREDIYSNVHEILPNINYITFLFTDSENDLLEGFYLCGKNNYIADGAIVSKYYDINSSRNKTQHTIMADIEIVDDRQYPRLPYKNPKLLLPNCHTIYTTNATDLLNNLHKLPNLKKIYII